MSFDDKFLKTFTSLEVSDGKKIPISISKLLLLHVVKKLNLIGKANSEFWERKFPLQDKLISK